MGWTFETQRENDTISGFNDSSIEKFGEKPTRSLIREGIQNACDASVGNQTVNVIVKKYVIQKNALGGFSQIEKHLKSCINEGNDPAENELIQRHIDAVEEVGYSIIEVSDYNTSGMTKEQFISMTQSEFKSTGKSKGSQGSKGVGKAAYYANSYLRSIIVVTKSDSGLRYRWASRLANHENPSKPQQFLMHRGLHGSTDSIQPSDIPSDFSRDENGTSIFIIGSWQDKYFENSAVKEVLKNFWFAILKEQLVVEIMGTKITKENIGELIEQHFTNYRDYKTGDKQNPRPYFDTITYGKVYKEKIPNIGECSLWLHKGDNFNLGAVARFRKTKMLIYKETDLDPGFAGVFLCDNDAGNAFLKDIENDEHNAWKKDINKEKSVKATETLKAISEFITQKYIEYAGTNLSNTITIDSIDDLFSFSSGKLIGGPEKIIIPPIIDKPSLPSLPDRILNSTEFTSFEENRKIYYSLRVDCKKAVSNQKFKFSIGTDSSKDNINIIESSEGKIDGSVLTLNVREGVNFIEKILFDVPFKVAPFISSIKSKGNEED